MWTLALIGLLVIPVAARIWAKKQMPRFAATITAATFGLVVSPLSMGLYATYFLGPFGIVTGMLGLVHDFYRPIAQCRLTAGVDEKGNSAMGVGHDN